MLSQGLDQDQMTEALPGALLKVVEGSRGFFSGSIQILRQMLIGFDGLNIFRRLSLAKKCI